MHVGNILSIQVNIIDSHFRSIVKFYNKYDKKKVDKIRKTNYAHLSDLKIIEADTNIGDYVFLEYNIERDKVLSGTEEETENISSLKSKNYPLDANIRYPAMLKEAEIEEDENDICKEMIERSIKEKSSNTSVHYKSIAKAMGYKVKKGTGMTCRELVKLATIDEINKYYKKLEDEFKTLYGVIVKIKDINIDYNHEVKSVCQMNNIKIEYPEEEIDPCEKIINKAIENKKDNAILNFNDVASALGHPTKNPIKSYNKLVNIIGDMSILSNYYTKLEKKYKTLYNISLEIEEYGTEIYVGIVR